MYFVCVDAIKLNMLAGQRTKTTLKYSNLKNAPIWRVGCRRLPLDRTRKRHQLILAHEAADTKLRRMRVLFTLDTRNEFTSVASGWAGAGRGKKRTQRVCRRGGFSTLRVCVASCPAGPGSRVPGDITLANGTVELAAAAFMHIPLTYSARVRCRSTSVCVCVWRDGQLYHRTPRLAICRPYEVGRLR